MLQHQDQPQSPTHGGGQQGSRGSPSSSLRNRKSDKDGNFNFLPGKDDNGPTGSGDENRNQVRPRNLGPMGRDPSPGYHHNSGVLSPRSRLPCWSTLEPLPEVETGDDGYGRVPPDGAEEGRMVEEGRRSLVSHGEEPLREKREHQGKNSRRGKEDVVMGLEDDDDEWGDSESDSEFSHHSGGSASSLNMDSGGEAALMGGWDRIGVGEPRSIHEKAEPNRNRSLSRSRMGSSLGNVLEEGAGLGQDQEEDEDEDQSSDSDCGQPELVMDAVWTLRDREHFKAQEMEKHQAQLTMYRRLALIRWVRTLQGRVLEQQDRLQSSFDIILTQRKELLRMGAATMANAAPAAATATVTVSQ
ncbi:uncharacterized protein c19h1orf216 isoform X3 [Nelusetta ayraudi]